MRRFLAALLVAFLIATPASATTILDSSFNGAAGTLPSGKWNAKLLSGEPDQSNAYFNGWTEVRLDGTGFLHINARHDQSGVWSTAWLTTTTDFEPVAPLSYVVRAKAAPGYGMWSAPGWSYRSPYGGGCGGEIDNVEQLGRQPLGVNESAHWCGNALTKFYTVPFTPADGFHRYRTDIRADRAVWKIDGITYATITQADAGNTWPFLNPTTFNISLNVGKCGGWAECPPPGAPDSEMVIDWFRVYK